MKKKAVQKIRFLCSIEMLLLLLTPCVHPLSMEVFADPVTIQEYRQRLPILENNSGLTAVPAPSLKFENDVDREQIEQEIRENIGKLDENGKQFKDYANSGSHNQNPAEGVSNQYAAEDLEPQTEPQLQDNPLNELEGRDGRTLDMDMKDRSEPFSGGFCIHPADLCPADRHMDSRDIDEDMSGKGIGSLKVGIIARFTRIDRLKIPHRLHDIFGFRIPRVRSVPEGLFMHHAAVKCHKPHVRIPQALLFDPPDPFFFIEKRTVTDDLFL